MKNNNRKFENIKNFDEWNNVKKKIDGSKRSAEFHEREIWWCSIGINIGSEQYSQTENFSRPVLVIRKFTRDIFWGVPLTTKIKQVPFRKVFVLNRIRNDLLILQMRAYDRKRLIRKIAVVPKQEFAKITDFVKSLL